MNDKTQPSKREDGFGTAGIGESGDGSMGETNSGVGGTGSLNTGGQRGGGHKVEGAFAEENAGAPGRRSPANKQGTPGQTD